MSDIYPNLMTKKSFTHIKFRYGITKEQYIQMYNSQMGLCAGCMKLPKSGGRNGCNAKLFVDHNHKTGDIRGLLCYACNASIGLSYDDPEVLISLSNYLKSRPKFLKSELTEWYDERKIPRTHCPNGHEYSKLNIVGHKKTDKSRKCRTCYNTFRRKYGKELYWRKKALNK